MSNTIDKQKLVEWLERKRKEDLHLAMNFEGNSASRHRAYAFAAETVIDEIQSGAFDIPNNHLRFPRQENSDGGWTISTNFLSNISNRLDDKCEELADAVPSWEQIEMVLLELEALNTSVTEPSADRVTLRPEVQWFAEQMELTLRMNDHKGGWQDCTLQYLFEKLDEEVGELSATLSDKETISEASDVANIVMMIADNARLSGLSAEKGADNG